VHPYKPLTSFWWPSEADGYLMQFVFVLVFKRSFYCKDDAFAKTNGIDSRYTLQLNEK
jgi:hypothetical protein